MPPKAKSGAGALARLQSLYEDPAWFLVQEVLRTNNDKVALENLRSFMEQNDPMSEECLEHQYRLQDHKKQEIKAMILAFLISVTQNHYGESSRFLMQLVLLCEQFQERGMVSQKTLNQLSTDLDLPENMQYSRDGFIPKLLDKMSHFMKEWKRLAYLKIHLEEKQKEHRDIPLYCQMVLATEHCYETIVRILADTTIIPDEKMFRIHQVCDDFHSRFQQPHAVGVFQHKVGCYIPTKEDILAILHTMDQLKITTVIDLFCGRALLVAILRLYTDVPIIGCDIKLHKPFATEGIRQFEASKFLENYLKTAKPNEKILMLISFAPSEQHLSESKIDHDDLAPQDTILSCRDLRVAGVALVTDVTDRNIMLINRGTVIGSEMSEDILSNPENYCLIHESAVPPMNRGVFQPCTPVETKLMIYKTQHKK